jgi:hypothetical protein
VALLDAGTLCDGPETGAGTAALVENGTALVGRSGIGRRLPRRRDAEDA